MLVFGRSFALGYGLKDNQTPSYFLSEITDYQVYNYAQNGWGAQHMLANLIAEDLQINK